MPRPRLEKPRYTLVRRKGRRAWYIRWTEHGRTHQSTTGTASRALAERVLADTASDKPQPRADIDGLIDAWLASRRHRASHPWLVKSAKQLKAHLAALGARSRPDLTEGLIADYIDRRGDKVTSCRRELELLRAATGVTVMKPARRPARQRGIERADAKRLLAAARGHLRLFIVIALTTGRRKGSILDLTWDRVDLRRGVIDFRHPEKGETNKRRGFSPIAKTLRGALQHARKWAQSDHVIEYRGAPLKDVRRGWKLAMARAGLGKGEGAAFRAAFSPHALKHSAISWLAEDGYSVDQISDLTDTDPKTVRRIYRGVNPGALRELADALGKSVHFGAKTGSRRPSFPLRSR